MQNKSFKTNNEVIDKYFAEKKYISSNKSLRWTEKDERISYQGGLNTTIFLSGKKLKETKYLRGEKQLCLKHKQDLRPSLSQSKFKENEP